MGDSQNSHRGRRQTCSGKHSRPVEKFDKRLWTLLDDMAQTMYDADGARPGRASGGRAEALRGHRRGRGPAGTGESQNRLEHRQRGAARGLPVRSRPPGHRGAPGKGAGAGPGSLRPAIEIEGEGFLDMALCHEIDHLDGIIYIDKMIEDVTDQYETEDEE